MYKVIEKEIPNPTVTKMVVEAPIVTKEALAGQFTILRVHEDGERIPLTITSYDREKDTITIIFQIAGKTATLLNQLNVGDSILDFAGSLDRSSRVDGYKKVCVTGKDVGCAIAYPTTKMLHENGTEATVITGFHSKDLVTLEEEFKQISTHVYLINGDGSTDARGLVTNMLEDLINKGESFDEVITIGPLIVMEFVCQLTKRYGIETVISMGPIMIDGTGMCGGCHLSVDGETKFACVDGPDFDGHLADFGGAMSRGAARHGSRTYARDIACNLMSREVR